MLVHRRGIMETTAKTAREPAAAGPFFRDRVAVLRLAAFAVVYLLAQAAAFALTAQPEGISVFWPPAGVMLAGLLIVPRRQWPSLAGALFLATVLANAVVGRGIGLNLALSANDLAVGLAGAWLFQSLARDRRPVNGLQPLAHFTLAAAVSALLSATVGAAAIQMAYGAAFWSVWSLWFGAMVLGIGLLAPPILTIANGARADLYGGRPWEFAIQACLALGIGALISADPLGHGLVPLIAAFAPVPILVWTAARRTPAETTLLLLAVSGLEIWGLMADHGPTLDIAAPIGERVLWLQSFLAMQASSVLILCAGLRARDRLEQLATERAARLQSIVETVPEAVIAIDARGIVESFSPAAERLFGYGAAEVVGRNVSLLMPEPHRDRHDGYLDRYLRTGERRIIGVGRIVRGRRKDGSTFPMELTVGEAVSQGKRLFTGFVRDISERQQTEQRLHELQNEMLHVSRLSAMGELASALAHELNQPLTAIKNYALAGRQLLQAGDGAREKVADVLNKTVEQSTRAGQIIRRLRSLVQNRDVERTREDIARVIDEANALAFVGLKERGIRAGIDYATGLPPVLIDKVQIQQVLINLIRNAIDAMAQSPHRELTIRTAAGGDGMVRIGIADTGSGIAPDMADKLFRPFITTKEDGMGVGLSISRTIVEAHGGRLWFEPNPGGGTVFLLELPAASHDA
jgi:two-component system sensor kinase FixL